MNSSYRLDHLHPCFDKHVLDIETNGGLARVAVHHFKGLETVESLPHSHPFDVQSTVLLGSYIEEVYHPLPDGYWWRETNHRQSGQVFHFAAETIHKIVALLDGDCITAVLQTGEAKPWRHWNFAPGKEVAPPGTK